MKREHYINVLILSFNFFVIKTNKLYMCTSAAQEKLIKESIYFALISYINMPCFILFNSFHTTLAVLLYI